MAVRIVISGMGAVSSIGCGKAGTLRALREGLSGIAPVRFLDTSLRDFPVGEVPFDDDSLARMAGCNPGNRTALLSVIAAREALSQAGLESIADAAFISGTTVGGMEKAELLYRGATLGNALPFDCGATTMATARALGAKGLCSTLSTACSSAANAIATAARLIRSGRCHVAVAGGSEALSDFHLRGFASLMILDRENCRPFDSTRAGLNLGEGAAYLVLESEENALRREAVPLAYLSGWGNACDAFHQTASSEDGEGAFLAMQAALKTAALKPSDIDYINAHGTGTPNNDASESAAIRRVFGYNLPPVSSTKGLTGHTTSASGAIESVFCLLSMIEGFIPGSFGFRAPDPSCISPCGTLQARPRHIMCNAFGFGGNDSSLIFSAP